MGETVLKQLTNETNRMLDQVIRDLRRLPYDAEIEYLESTGTQYVDTDIKPNQNTAINCKLYNPIDFSVDKPGSILFGARNSGNIPTFTVIGNALNAYGMRWDYGSSNIATNNYPLTIGEHTILKNKQYNYLDGVLVATNSVSTFSVNYPMHIFGNNTAGRNTLNFKGRYYYFKIFDNDELVRDFIPVRLGTTGYLYDKVSGQLFGNAGTDEFVLGQDKKTTRDYVQDGLVAIWDGIENTRERESMIQAQLLG